MIIATTLDLVRDGEKRDKIPLTENLEHYLCITVAHYLEYVIRVDNLTITAMEVFDARAKNLEVRRIGDDCLVTSALFRKRLKERGFSLSNVEGIGRTSYRAAGLLEQAIGFGLMRDVLSASCIEDLGLVDVDDLIEMARAGSAAARGRICEMNIVPFGRPRR